MANGDDGKPYGKDEAAKKAAAGADKLVRRDDEADVPALKGWRRDLFAVPSDNPNIESLKKIILSNTQVQQHLADAADHADFVKRVAALSVEHKVTVSADEVQSHLQAMARWLLTDGIE